LARISIVHSTKYSYRNAVGLTRHRLMLRPDDSHDLRLHHAALDVDPKPSLGHWTHDAFDNSICFLEWPKELRTKRLSIVSNLDLTHHPEGPPLPAYSLNHAAGTFPFAYSSEEIPDLASLAKRQEPDPGGSVDAWARRFIGASNEARTLAILEAMTHAIKTEFRYEARYAEGTQTAAETVEAGSGTCRDFAVLMMEALRRHALRHRVSLRRYVRNNSRGRKHACLVQCVFAGGGMDGIRSDERFGRRREPHSCRRSPVRQPSASDLGGICGRRG
jgi:hypothetical protein